MKSLIFNNRGSIPLVLMIIVACGILASTILSYAYYYTNLNDTIINQHDAQQLAMAGADKTIQDFRTAINNDIDEQDNNTYLFQELNLPITTPLPQNLLSFDNSFPDAVSSNIQNFLNSVQGSQWMSGWMENHSLSIIKFNINSGSTDPTDPNEYTINATITSKVISTMGTKKIPIYLSTNVVFQYYPQSIPNSPVKISQITYKFSQNEQ